jgi:hypothetical protein
MFAQRVSKSLALVAGLSLVTIAPAHDPPGGHDPRPGERPAARGPDVDVVLCLDTSNSMDGLILAAKAKLWDIINDLSRLRPTPTLRVGLYSYGNDSYPSSSGWIRKELDLGADLDEVYRKLNALSTNGGTELATRVGRDALIQQRWSGHPKALRLLFICGNEPADQDRETPIPEIAAAAKRQGVSVHTIFCGPPQHSDARSWRAFATLAGGAFTAINTSEPVYVPKTPYDEPLYKWGIKLNSTYVPYGSTRERKDKTENQVAQDTNAWNLGGGVGASRAVVKAGAQYRNPTWDLCDRLKEDPKFDVNSLPDDQLPEDVRKLPKEKRQAFVQTKLQERGEIAKQIEDLNKKRTAHIDAERRRSSAGKKPGAGLDEALQKVIREEAKQRGFEIGG